MILKINLSPIQYHLFRGSWKIHHILSDEEFKAKKWHGYGVFSTKKNGGSSIVYTDKIFTQHIEVVPGNASDRHYWRILLDGKIAVEQRRFACDGQLLLHDLQRNEGLTAYEFHNKKFDLHGDDLKYFSGRILHFTEFRYHL